MMLPCLVGWSKCYRRGSNGSRNKARSAIGSILDHSRRHGTGGNAAISHCLVAEYNHSTVDHEWRTTRERRGARHTAIIQGAGGCVTCCSWTCVETTNSISRWGVCEMWLGNRRRGIQLWGCGAFLPSTSLWSSRCLSTCMHMFVHTCTICMYQKHVFI